MTLVKTSLYCILKLPNNCLITNKINRSLNIFILLKTKFNASKKRSKQTYKMSYIYKMRARRYIKIYIQDISIYKQTHNMRPRILPQSLSIWFWLLYAIIKHYQHTSPSYAQLWYGLLHMVLKITGLAISIKLIS